MANTVIALKKSSTPSATPASLANGELAINYADGKLFYRAANGTIVEFASGTNSFGTINANGTFVVADTTSDVLSLLSGRNINIVGDAINDSITIALANDVVIPSSGTFKVAAAGGDEGGEIKLANAITNSVLTSDIIIDIYQNKLRFFESGGTNRGAFIDLSAASTGVGTDLLASSGSVDSTARATASAAFTRANLANLTANTALANTDGITFGGTLNISQNVVADRVISTNNGIGENFKVGDDAWIGDTNLANALRIKGQQNTSHGYIMFGPNDGKLLGRAGTDNLTYDGNTVWHAGTDGAGSGLDADLLDGQHGTYYAEASTVAGAYDKANSANLLAFAALANTDGITFGGTLNATKNITADKIISSNNGNNENFRIGDDVWIGDTNISNTFRIKGVQDPQQAYIIFNTVDNKALGRSGSGALTWDGNTLWHSGNDGAGFGLDADLLDGQHGTYYATATTASAAYDKANSANLLAFNTGAGANAFTSATIAGANTAVGSGANAYAATVGTSANAYSDSTFVKLTASSQTITGNVDIVGNLTLSGNTFVIEATQIQVDDPLLYLAANNYTSDIVDIGFIANYVNSTGANVHTGLYREHVDKMYYLFQGYDKEPINNHIGALSNNMTLAVLNADLRTSNLELAGQNTIVWITSAYDKANDANLLAYNTGIGANAFTSATIAGANVISSAAFNKANSANITADLSFNTANAAFDKANTGGGSAYYSGNNGDVGNATGLGDIFRVHTNTLSANVTIYSGNNALAAGPITVALGKTLTIQANARVAIV